MPLPVTWLLMDDRMSHCSQISGVAQLLDWPCTVKEIRYNRLAGLANAPFGARLWHLTPETRNTLSAPWPDLVIAAGRRSAPVALAIKKRSPRTRIVHLMWPDVAPARFSLIAVPEHDNLSYHGPNLLRTLGAPHALTPAELNREAARWKPQVARMPRPHIAVLIGGPSRMIQFGPEDFKALAAYASAEAERLGGSLLITSSPRTPMEAESLMKPIITVPHILHRFQAGVPNPYVGFLGLADAVIVTGDSISMCSEAAATERPLYIFTPPHLREEKGGFRELLFSRGYAKSHTYPIRLDWKPTLMPSAAYTVAQAIRAMMQ
jgi:mitochondrial fission protein ELM1